MCGIAPSGKFSSPYIISCRKVNGVPARITADSVSWYVLVPTILPRTLTIDSSTLWCLRNSVLTASASRMLSTLNSFAINKIPGRLNTLAKSSGFIYWNLLFTRIYFLANSVHPVLACNTAYSSITSSRSSLDRLRRPTEGDSAHYADVALPSYPDGR